MTEGCAGCAFQHTKGHNEFPCACCSRIWVSHDDDFYCPKGKAVTDCYVAEVVEPW